MARQAPNFRFGRIRHVVKAERLYNTITSKLNPSAKSPAHFIPHCGRHERGKALLKQPDPNRRGNKKKLTDDTSSLASDMTFATDSRYGDDDSARSPYAADCPGLNNGLPAEDAPANRRPTFTD
ncbi:hypothetical protein BV898_16267 [Hypsibius exemplaris]|uniref:Uncharacterized protein n=1 Tax=Hypsibius exemplaris TaxID=2072580 RepID=A0A9X6RLM8_HYPEX|nr:hypothetical protein BV898_16267 [Hypsibius exemplaris]